MGRFMIDRSMQFFVDKSSWLECYRVHFFCLLRAVDHPLKWPLEMTVRDFLCLIKRGFLRLFGGSTHD